MVEPAGISIAKLNFGIGQFSLKNVSLDIPRGEYFVLSGPNGSGKSLLLKLLAGLLRPDSGELWIQGRRITQLPPWKRNVGYVPQDGLLFPNYTVAQNIEFGLRVRHLTRQERRRQVDRMAEMLHITPLLDRNIRDLSGGEQQKTALARALALSPSVLLFDEPVSAIDEQTRDPLCLEMKRVQRQLGITTIHVSHNSRETALVADRVGFIKDGVLDRRFQPTAASNSPSPVSNDLP